MRFTTEQLTFKALLVVREAVHQCSSRHINLSLGLRFNNSGDLPPASPAPELADRISGQLSACAAGQRLFV